jgi:predicted amidohydrolase/ribosomal protein S18 acetylase RimI-like enzyme
MESTSKKIKIREMSEADIPSIVDLNKRAYPGMAEDDVVWGESHLRSHLRIFPQGQLVAVLDGKIAGSASSLIVHFGIDQFRHHTWSGITDSGYFLNHDANGDTLYGADVCVDPDVRCQGVGHELYEARRNLCKRLNLRRILAGGRLHGYDEYASQMSADEYAERVSRGELHDLVLSFQLKEHFVLRGVMKNYLIDSRSHNHATLIEWQNPDYKPYEDDERKVRIACVQYQMRKVKSFAEFARQVTYFVDVAADYKSDFILLPELITVQLLSAVEALSPQDGMKKLSSFTKKFVKLLKDLSMRFGVTIIGGSHPVLRDGRLYNIAFVSLPDGTIIEQPKLHVTPNERKWWGITGGNSLVTIDTPKARIGVLICYDVEFPEAVRHLSDEGVEVLFVPFCTDTRQGYLRVRYCAHARAIENQIYVALAGNVGNLPDVTNMDIQYGQAAVLTPSDFAFSRDGIAAEADSNEETVLICDLDLDSLQLARTHGTVTPRLDRRPDLFKFKYAFPDASENSQLDRPLGDQRKFQKGD